MHVRVYFPFNSGQPGPVKWKVLNYKNIYLCQSFTAKLAESNMFAHDEQVFSLTNVILFDE